MKRKNQCWLGMLTALFIVTLCALGRFSFAEQFRRAADDPAAADGAYRTIFTLELGDVEARTYRSMGGIRAFLQFSPDGGLLVAGTARGEIIAVRTDWPQVVWRERIGVGKITAVAFAADGRSLYVGEASPEGNLYCLDSQTGRKRWQYATAPAIGANIKDKSLPDVVKIAPLADRVYAAALRYERVSDGSVRYFSQLLCLDDAGRAQWVFPADGAMDAWVSWFGVDGAGAELVFGTANFSPGIHRYDRNLYALDGATGAVNWSRTILPLADARRTVMRGSPSISADGAVIAALASDGRGFLYDRDGKLLWRRTISEPKRLGGVYINAVGREAYVSGDLIVFGALNTYNSANWQLPTPVEHPSGNNVVVFDRAGRFVSRWQAGGSVEELAFSHPYAAVAVGRNTQTHNPRIHGLYLYSLPDGAVTGRIATDGPAVAAAVCRQGDLAATAEAPLKLDDGKIIGAYRLILAEKNHIQ